MGFQRRARLTYFSALVLGLSDLPLQWDTGWPGTDYPEEPKFFPLKNGGGVRGDIPGVTCRDCGRAEDSLMNVLCQEDTNRHFLRDPQVVRTVIRASGENQKIHI